MPSASPPPCKKNDADCVGLFFHSRVIDIYIVIARAEISTSTITQCDVVLATAVIAECVSTDGSVIVAGMGTKERMNTDSRVAATACTKKCLKTDRAVAATATTEPRGKPDSRVAATGCVAIERRLVSDSRINSVPVVLLWRAHLNQWLRSKCRWCCNRAQYCRWPYSRGPWCC